MIKHIIALAGFLALCLTPSKAQQWMNIHHRSNDAKWRLPILVDDIADIEAPRVTKKLQLEMKEGDGLTFNLSDVDSLTFSNTLPDSLEQHNPYDVYTMYIYTEGGSSIKSKEDYVNCRIYLDGKEAYASKAVTGRIRGRGNSTWEWYPKKPYRIKLDEKHKMLGLAKNKDWVLLANYRDMTDMMNVFAFEAARWMGMPYTNHTRFVELFINGQYNGIYQLTEQVEQGKSRVDVADEGGILLALDADDGPSLSPNAGNNFSSTVYSLPVCVKYPKEPSTNQLDSIKQDFAVIEKAIKAHDYDLLDSLMDIPSFISMLQLQSYLYNVELSAPRSIFLFKDAGGKYTWGPMWDFDAGYDFSWSDMYTGHTFFEDYKETLFGSDPVKRNGTYRVSPFFVEMFANDKFVTQYKQTWRERSDSLFLHAWGECERYLEHLNAGAFQREEARWPIEGFDIQSEITKMSVWLQKRKDYVGTLIKNYPGGENNNEGGGNNDEGDDTPIIPGDGVTVVGTITKNVTMKNSEGYSQSVSISVNKSTVANMLGVSEAKLNVTNTTLVPLMADGSLGKNTAAGIYGAWFDANGNTVSYGSSNHVFIESDELWSWSCGLEKSACKSGDKHTVIMQYQYATAEGNKAVNVKVNFTIEAGDNNWWWW